MKLCSKLYHSLEFKLLLLQVTPDHGKKLWLKMTIVLFQLITCSNTLHRQRVTVGQRLHQHFKHILPPLTLKKSSSPSESNQAWESKKFSSLLPARHISDLKIKNKSKCKYVAGWNTQLLKRWKPKVQLQVATTELIVCAVNHYTLFGSWDSYDISMNYYQTLK